MYKICQIAPVSGFALASVISAGAHAQDQPPEAPPGAIVIKDGGCYWYVPVAPTGDGDFFIEFFYTEDAHTVVTPSGRSTVTCRFELPANIEVDRALVARDGFCFSGNGVAFEGYRVTTTPSGRALAVCTQNPSGPGIIFPDG